METYESEGHEIRVYAVVETTSLMVKVETTLIMIEVSMINI